MYRLRRTWLSLASGCCAAPALSQRLGGAAATPDLSIGRILAALVLCVAAAFALVLLIRARSSAMPGASPIRRRLGSAASRRIRVIETRRASAHADLCLIECDGDEYLLLCGPAVHTVLHAPEHRRGA